MKNVFKIVTSSLLVLVLFINCDGDDNITSTFDAATNGGFLRTIELISNEIPIGESEAQFAVEVEAFDSQNGNLLQSVDVLLTFSDNTPEDGDSSAGIFEEVLFTTIGADAFVRGGEDNLPRTVISVTLAEMLSTFNLEEDAIFGGDAVETRLVLNLTDGSSFSASNSDADITGLSPFTYTSNVVCPIPDDYFLGEYLMERISTEEDPFFPSFGPAFDTELVTVTGSGSARSFAFTYFPDPAAGFSSPYIMSLVLSCDNFLVMGTIAPDNGTLGCGDGSIGQSTPDIPTTYDLDNDDVLEIGFNDFDPDAGCGTGGYPVLLRLTRQ